MELYNLVETRNYLMKFLEDNVDFLGYDKCFNRIPESIKAENDTFKLIFPLIENLKISNEKVKTFITEQITILNNQIENLTKEYHKSGYDIKLKDGQIQKQTIYAGPLAEKKRILDTPEDILEDIQTVIRNKSEWRFPSLEIGCGNEDISRCMPTSDPYYVTDIHIETLTSLKNMFNEIYKRKIRCYVNKNEDKTNFNFLPQEQFKFILSWNVLNYYPKTEFKQFLSSCWDLLRPGGSMIFSYNDCDYRECVKKFEYGVGSWMNESMVLEVLKEVGFTINNISHNYEIIHWVDCQKPGDLSSVKLSAPIGRIII